MEERAELMEQIEVRAAYDHPPTGDVNTPSGHRTQDTI
jgi:hypothetical protein